MPAINLRIGPMSLEGDATAKGDSVMAHLYNGYRGSSTDGSQTIQSIPGYQEFCDLGTGNATIDGDYYSILHGVRIAVSAGRAWKIATDGTKEELTGVVLTAGTPVSFTEDETSIGFCAKSAINWFDPTTTTVTQLGGQAPVNCTHLAYLKGYLVALGDDVAGGGIPGDVWYASSVTSYATWSVFNNMARPDGVSAVFATFREIYAVGRETTEVSYATTDPSAPFASNDGATQPFGTQAPYSVAFDGQSIYYLTTIGGNRRVCRLAGGREVQLLSFAVDVPIDVPPSITDARGWIQSWQGQTFYVLQMPTTQLNIDNQIHKGITLVFNIKLNEWYIWYEWDSINAECKRYPADTFLYVEGIGRRFIGYQGKLWEQTEATLKFNTTPIRMRIRTGNRSWGKLALKISNGYRYNIKRGATGDIAEPNMIHRWRNDSDAEWKIGRVKSLGAEGSRTLNLSSTQCGRYRTRQDEFIFPDPVAIVFNGVEEDITVLK